jgi:hypothetical protein
MGNLHTPSHWKSSEARLMVLRATSGSACHADSACRPLAEKRNTLSHSLQTPHREAKHSITLTPDPSQRSETLHHTHSRALKDKGGAATATSGSACHAASACRPTTQAATAPPQRSEVLHCRCHTHSLALEDERGVC